MKYFFFFILISGQALAEAYPVPYVEPTRVLRAQGYQIGVYTDSFTTSKEVDDNGKSVSLPEGSSFNRLQAEVLGQYGATNELQFGAGFRFRQNAAVSELAGDRQTAASSGIQSTFANITYAFPKVDQMKYTVEGTFRYIPYTNDQIDVGSDLNTLILGDTGNEVSAGLGMTYLAKNNNFLTVRGGYRIPGADLSHEIYYQVEGAMVWKHVGLVAGVNGISSMNNDPFESVPEERPNLNAQTRLYNSINREMIAPYAGINIALGNTWRVELRGSQVVSGTSTALGSIFGINLIRRSEKSTTRLLDNKFKTYDLEATVTKVSPKKEFLEIDKGIADDITKGMRMDFFEFDYIGGNVLVASGIVVKTKSETAVVQITQRFNQKKELKEGLIGRATLK